MMRYLLDDAQLRIIRQRCPELVAHLDDTDALCNDPRRDDAIGLAREQTDDDLEIDDEPELSPSDDGVWVAAWIWISNYDIGVEDVT